MVKLWRNLFFVMLLLTPCIIQMFGEVGKGSTFVRAEDDDGDSDLVEGEEDDVDATVEDGGSEGSNMDEDVLQPPSDAAQTTDKGDDDDETEDTTLKPSPDAKTNFIFVKPLTQDLPAGQEVRVLIGFTNKGEKEFVVETIDASLRYPQDFSYYIQNFTTYRLYQSIEPSKEATFEYRFVPSDTLSSRPFGLVINVNYKDVDGGAYLDAIFNSTINIVEPDEGLDGEIFFLYIFLIAIVILAGVGIYQLVASLKKKHLGSKPKQTIELGTQNKGDVDYDWIPKEALINNKSPKSSPRAKTSPRQRNKKRIDGAVDE